MHNVTIYHNPRCSKSRETLNLLRAQGIEPLTVSYLDTPLSAATLATLIKQLGFSSARQLLRHKESEYKELALDNPSLTEAELIAVMIAHPKLIERPIVICNGKARLGRPPQEVLTILS